MLKRPASEGFSDEELFVMYEIRRTIQEIRRSRWRKIALQFPDEMLEDAPRVFEALSRGLQEEEPAGDGPSLHGDMRKLDLDGQSAGRQPAQSRLYILADTSYGACCVDEVAAEHVDAEVVVHYGRACLSPTSRIPVMHVFTSQPLPSDPVIQAFMRTFPDRTQKVILMADVTHASHVPSLRQALDARGYTNLHSTSITHDPSSPLPNRTLPDSVTSGEDDLRNHHLFHISEPLGSLLLTLSSRVASVRVYATGQSPLENGPHLLEASTTLALRRRYALLASLSTASIFGILINTLSVKNYLGVVEHVKKQITAAGKKSYTFVVGKVNAAKLANFSEVDGWVVISCWESSLIDSKDFWKPVITPWELTLALQSDAERVWTGEWVSDFDRILADARQTTTLRRDAPTALEHDGDDQADGVAGDLDSEPESAPPEFDLRTGRLVSHTRPMQEHYVGASDDSASTSQALTRKRDGSLARIGGQASPGAQYLHSQRTWRGLGSDFEIAYEQASHLSGSSIEQGRSGLARGYHVGTEHERH